MSEAVITVKQLARYLGELCAKGMGDWVVHVRVWDSNTCVPITSVDERTGIVEIYHGEVE